MGTTSTREKIKSKMLKLKLRRIEIKQERIERVNQLGIQYLVLHPGSHVGLGIEAGINNIIKGMIIL